MPTRSNEAVWLEKYQRWQIKVQREGIRKTFTSKIKGIKGKVAAERAADKWIDGGGKKDNIRFGQLYRQYTDSIDTGHSSAHKKKQEQVGKLWLLPRWEHKKASSLTNKDYQDAVSAPVKERKQPLSRKTCEHIRGAISGVYSFAMSDKIEMEAPYKLKIPKGATEGEKRIMTPSDIKTLFLEDTTILRNKEKRDFYINAYRLSVLMGYRRGEVCGLGGDDKKTNTLNVNRSVNRELEETPGKSKKAKRGNVLPVLAQKVLEDQEKMLKSAGIISPWLFPDPHGRRLNPQTLYKRWVRFQEFHDMTRISFHEIRHSMVSEVIEDMPMSLLKEMIGHTKEMDTFQYNHVKNGDSQKAADIIDQVFSKILAE